MPPGRTVLLVDDDPDVAVLVAVALDRHEVLHASDGRAALALLDQRPVDLVVSDLAMPGMDGRQLLAAVVARPDPPPVLMVTAHAAPAARVELLREGARDLLGKPFSVEELRARVDNLLDVALLQRAVQDANAQLALRNRELDRYAAHVAHDLRGPLTVVAAFAGILAGDPQLPEHMRDPLDRIRSSARRAQRLVDTLLDDAGGGRHEVVDLADVVATVAAQVREDAPELQVEVDGALPEVRGRAASLRQLVGNLLRNSVAYARPGVAPRVVVSGGGGDGELAVVRFADNGRGVPPDEREAVLEEGRRGTAASSAGRPGSGVGLAAARAVAAAHGGRLWLEDGPGGPGGPGVTVVVRLRRAAGPSARR